MRYLGLFVALCFPSHLFAQTLPCVPDGPRVALTFDDGPLGERTSHILEILQRHGAQATFFLVGRQVAHQESLVQREVDEGHEVGVHTWSHKNLSRSSARTRAREITKGFEAVRRAVPEASIKWWRAPYGAGARLGQGVAGSFGLRHQLWNIDTLDWTGASSSVLLARVLTHVRSGDVVLMHDHGEHTIEALDTMLMALENRSYQMVSVSRLVAPVCSAGSTEHPFVPPKPDTYDNINSQPGPPAP